jgi:hypothetical protein
MISMAHSPKPLPLEQMTALPEANSGSGKSVKIAHAL